WNPKGLPELARRKLLPEQNSTFTTSHFCSANHVGYQCVRTLRARNSGSHAHAPSTTLACARRASGARGCSKLDRKYSAHVWPNDIQKKRASDRETCNSLKETPQQNV